MHPVQTRTLSLSLIVALTLSLGAVAASLLPMGASQAGPLMGTVEGVVTDAASGAPIGQAAVTASSKLFGSRSATTDASGTYALALEPGAWSLLFEKEGYKPVNASVAVSTGQTQTRNASLEADAASPRSVAVHVVDASEQGIQGALVSVYGEQGDGTAREATTDASGTATFTLSEGSYRAQALKKGYRGSESWFWAGPEGSSEVTLWMQEAPIQTVKITGQVLDQATGSGVQALVELRPDYDSHATHAEPAGAGGTAVSSSTMIAPDCYDCRGPTHDHWNSSVSAADGSFEMWAYAGDVVLSANKADYLVAQIEMTLEENRSYVQNLDLEQAPPKDVTIRGRIVEEGSGTPLSNAYVSISGQEYPDWASAQTDADGRFDLQVRRGVTQVHASHWEDAGASCPPEADCMVMPEGNLGRGHLSRVLTLRLEAGETRDVTLELPKRPEPTATILGYALDEESGIAGARVSFYNEETGDWGSATTDEDGSYRIAVRGGWFNVHVWADGFFGHAESFRVDDGQTTRADFTLFEGEARQMGWWGGDGGGVRPMPLAAEDSASGAPSMSRATAGASDGEAAGPTGSNGSTGSGIQYVGTRGDLGPYDPNSVDATQESPFWGALGAMVALVGAAVLVAHRGR